MQNVIAILIVAMAAAYLGWRGWCVMSRKRAASLRQRMRQLPGQPNDGAAETLVTIQPLAPKNDRN